MFLLSPTLHPTLINTETQSSTVQKDSQLPSFTWAMPMSGVASWDEARHGRTELKS